MDKTKRDWSQFFFAFIREEKWAYDLKMQREDLKNLEGYIFEEEKSLPKSDLTLQQYDLARSIYYSKWSYHFSEEDCNVLFCLGIEDRAANLCDSCRFERVLIVRNQLKTDAIYRRSRASILYHHWVEEGHQSQRPPTCMTFEHYLMMHAPDWVSMRMHATQLQIRS